MMRLGLIIGAMFYAVFLLSIAFSLVDHAKQLDASHERLIWSFDVLANDRASADMMAADEAAKGSHRQQGGR
jgi:hypothetical protein